MPAWKRIFREVKRHLHGGLINCRRANILLKIFVARAWHHRLPRSLILTGFRSPLPVAAPAFVSLSSSLTPGVTRWRFVCFHLTSSLWSLPRTGHLCSSSVTHSSWFALRRLLRSSRLRSPIQRSLRSGLLLPPTRPQSAQIAHGRIGSWSLRGFGLSSAAAVPRHLPDVFRPSP